MREKTVGLVVNGTMEIHPDDREKFIALVARNVAESRGVEGCLGYAFTVDVSNPNLLHNVEAWSDRESLEKHMSSELMQAAFAEVKKLRLLARDVTAYTVGASTKI